MSRREAALILGLRESAAEERIKEAHRRIMIANHPDSGGCVAFVGWLGVGRLRVPALWAHLNRGPR
jgi:hypothetical protein